MASEKTQQLQADYNAAVNAFIKAADTIHGAYEMKKAISRTVTGVPLPDAAADAAEAVIERLHRAYMAAADAQSAALAALQASRKADLAAAGVTA